MCERERKIFNKEINLNIEIDFYKYIVIQSTIIFCVEKETEREIVRGKNARIDKRDFSKRERER